MGMSTGGRLRRSINCRKLSLVRGLQSLLAVLDVLSSSPARPFSSARHAPLPDGTLTHFASPHGEKCKLIEGHGVASGSMQKKVTGGG